MDILTGTVFVVYGLLLLFIVKEIHQGKKRGKK